MKWRQGTKQSTPLPHSNLGWLLFLTGRWNSSKTLHGWGVGRKASSSPNPWNALLGKVSQLILSPNFGTETCQTLIMLRTRPRPPPPPPFWQLFLAVCGKTMTLLPPCPALLTHKNLQRCKMIHGMFPLGRKDQSINLNMCICRNIRPVPVISVAVIMAVV